jgi:hypothetical protein
MRVKPSVGKNFQRSSGPQVSLFTQVLECNLDAFVIEGLKVAAKLVAAIGPLSRQVNSGHRKAWVRLEKIGESHASWRMRPTLMMLAFPTIRRTVRSKSR